MRENVSGNNKLSCVASIQESCVFNLPSPYSNTDGEIGEPVTRYAAICRHVSMVSWPTLAMAKLSRPKASTA